LALAKMVIPRVVHEGHAVVDRVTDNLDTVARVLRLPDVESADPDKRDLRPGAPQRPILHSTGARYRRDRFARGHRHGRAQLSRHRKESPSSHKLYPSRYRLSQHRVHFDRAFLSSAALSRDTHGNRAQTVVCGNLSDAPAAERRKERSMLEIGRAAMMAGVEDVLI